MKMIGMSTRWVAISFCSSRPLRSGREMSSTRQLGACTRGRARNSSAQENVSGCQPAKPISSSSDSRTETSSSTTKTIGLSCNVGDAVAELINEYHLLLNESDHPQCCIKRCEQITVAEWFEQTVHGTVFD